MSNEAEYGPWMAWQKGFVAPYGKAQIFKSCGTINTNDALDIDWSDVVAYRVKKEPEVIVYEGHFDYGLNDFYSMQADDDDERNVKITIQGETIKAEWAE